MMFKNKIALITGSTSGLGEAISKKLAQEGAQGLVITGRDLKRGERVVSEIQEMGCQAFFKAANLEDVNQCRALFDVIDNKFDGRIHGLVNSAAYTGRGTIEETPVSEWDKHQAVNIRAPFILIQEAVQRMQKHGISGSILNIGSVSGHAGFPFLTPYACSKGALITLTKNVAQSQREHRIRCNAILPGWMDTPAEHAIQKEYYNAPDDWLEKAEAEQAFGKLVKPDEVADLVALILSDRGGVMTGSIIDYDQKVIGAQQ